MSNTICHTKTVHGRDIQYDPNIQFPDEEGRWSFRSNGKPVDVYEYEGRLVLMYSAPQYQNGVDAYRSPDDLRAEMDQMQGADGLGMADVIDESWTKWYRSYAQGKAGLVRYLNRIVAVTPEE